MIYKGYRIEERRGRFFVYDPSVVVAVAEVGSMEEAKRVIDAKERLWSSKERRNRAAQEGARRYGVKI